MSEESKKADAEEILREKRELAQSLAGQLRDLADACIKAAEGDADAKKLLEDNTDGHWRALVIGTNKIETLWMEDEPSGPAECPNCGEGLDLNHDFEDICHHCGYPNHQTPGQ